MNRLGRTVWNVKILERYDHGSGVATYLAQYLKGGPIGNGRLLAVRDGRVWFRYRIPATPGSDRNRQETTMEQLPWWCRDLQRADHRRFWATAYGEDYYDWYLETQVEGAKESEPEPVPIQLYLPGLTPRVSFEIESF